MQISVRSQTAAQTTLSWQPVAGAARYRILWSDRPGETVRFKTAGESGESLFTFCRSTHIPYYIKVQALAENGTLLEESTPVQTPVGRVRHCPADWWLSRQTPVCLSAGGSLKARSPAATPPA